MSERKIRRINPAPMNLTPSRYVEVTPEERESANELIRALGGVPDDDLDD